MWKDLTGLDYYRKSVDQRDTTGASKYLVARVKSKNLYSGFTSRPQDTGYNLFWIIPKDLSKGSHFISLVFNAEQGHIKFYVDGVEQSSSDTGLGQYAFNDMLTEPLLVGAAPYFNNRRLDRYIRKPGHYFAKDMKITDLRVFSKPLTHYEIQSHMAKCSYCTTGGIKDLKWDVPTGQRNFIDTVERFFKFKTPDRKSTAYNLRILNSLVTNTSMRTEIEKAIAGYLPTIVPLHTKLNTITWRNDDQ